MEARNAITKTMAAGIKKHNTLSMTKNTNYQRIVRGHNRYTNYHSYRKMGGRNNWSQYKSTK